MKYILIYLLFIVSIPAIESSCYNDKFDLEDPIQFLNQISEKIKSIENPNNKSNLQQSKTIDFFKTITEINNLQSFSLKFGDSLINKIESNLSLSGYELLHINKIISVYKLSALKISNFFKSIPNINLNDFINLQNISKTKENLTWLAANLVLYQNFISNYRVYFLKEGKLRRLVKIDNISKTKNSRALLLIIKKVTSPQYFEHISKAIDLFKLNQSDLKLSDDFDLKLLSKIINNNIFKRKNIIKRTITTITNNIIDQVIKQIHNLTFIASKKFGNTISNISWGHGSLYKNTEVKKYLISTLKPLDIIIEKSSQLMTDLLIPGHFGHSAIWLGDELSLKELNLWDNKYIIPLHNKIKDGFQIIEALRDGVQLNRIDSFLNIDELVILRQKSDLFLKENKNIIKVLTKQIGKNYDFNFNLFDSTTITCAELIYLAYGKITWPTKIKLARRTITPDNIAELLFYDNGPMNFVKYIKGRSDDNFSYGNINTLSKILGYEINRDRSSGNYISYDKIETKCRDTFESIPNTFLYKDEQICEKIKFRRIYYPPKLIKDEVTDYEQLLSNLSK